MVVKSGVRMAKYSAGTAWPSAAHPPVGTMSETFKNAPVVAVIFQLRFAGESVVEIARPRIQQALRPELPKLFVPTCVPGEAPALQPYSLRAADESEAVDLAVNSFAYVSKRYQGFNGFRQSFEKFYRVFSQHVEIHSLHRVGLRYINHIPVLRESATAAIPLEDYVKVGFKLPSGIPGANLTQLDSTFTVRVDEGSLRLSLQFQKLDTPKQDEVLVLDFDFSLTEDLQVDRVPEYLTRAHEHTKRIFLEMIADKYLPVMKGEDQ
jgi:uncharacterized protein (TIGR04255 family)